MKDDVQRDLADRTRAFAVRVMRLGDSLPHSRSANVIAYQLIKAGTSVGAHYREGMRSRSDAEIISKFETPRKLAALRSEADELTAIFVACVKKVKARPRR